MSRIEIPVPGSVLVGDFYPAARPRLAFVVSHGWGSSRPQDIPRELVAAGFSALAYDLRGHGESSAAVEGISPADWVDDLAVVIDRLGELAPGVPIALVGASLGAYLSVLATTRRSVRALALRVPANLPDDAFDHPLLPRLQAEMDRLWRENPATPADNAALAALNAFTGVVQIVDADQDDRIPPQTLANYVAAIADPRRLTRATLRNAPHYLATPELRREYLDLLLTWAAGAV